MAAGRARSAPYESEDLMCLMMAALGLSLLVTAGCQESAPPPSADGRQPVADLAPPLLEPPGKHSRPVTTTNRMAQVHFDQGLNYLYAFNHDEAIRSFERAAESDPTCAMAHW